MASHSHVLFYHSPLQFATFLGVAIAIYFPGGIVVLIFSRHISAGSLVQQHRKLPQATIFLGNHLMAQTSMMDANGELDEHQKQANGLWLGL